MDPQKQRLVIEGNAFYEIDMECVRQKQKQKETEENQHKKKQRR